MTLKEAKKILEKEGFYVVKATRPCAISESFTEYEDPTICEAMQVVCSAGYFISMEMNRFDERKARLKEEYEKNTKALGPSEEQPKEDNPALKEAASQFNDSLLDEQAKKIEKLTKENEDWKSWHEMQNRTIAINNIAFRNEKNRLGKEIARLNKIIHKKNMKIEEFRKESSRHLREKIKVFYENRDLEGKLKDKDAVLSDVAEELRLTKIREKNLVELGLKHVGENEELKKELANKVVDKIDAQALKSAESALAWKDKVIADLTKKLNVKHKKYVYYNGTIVAVQRLVNTLAGYAAKRYYKELCDQMVDIAEEGGDQSATIVQCDNGIILSKEEAEIIERCTKNGTELHYSEKYGLTYTNVFGEELPIRCLRGMFHVFTDEEIKNMKK